VKTRSRKIIKPNEVSKQIMEKVVKPSNSSIVPSNTQKSTTIITQKKKKQQEAAENVGKQMGDILAKAFKPK
jgi:hypothetical protein